MRPALHGVRRSRSARLPLPQQASGGQQQHGSSSPIAIEPQRHHVHRIGHAIDMAGLRRCKRFACSVIAVAQNSKSGRCDRSDNNSCARKLGNRTQQVRPIARSSARGFAQVADQSGKTSLAERCRQVVGRWAGIWHDAPNFGQKAAKGKPWLVMHGQCWHGFAAMHQSRDTH